MPDGRHVLIATGFDLTLLDAERWEPAQLGLLGTLAFKGGHPAFSTQNSRMALVTPEEQILLLDSITGQPWLTLSSPDPQPIRRMVFDQSGEHLAVATDNYEVQLWDLAALRRELARLGLDWPDERPDTGFVGEKTP